jgi:hypothetical protein
VPRVTNEPRPHSVCLACGGALAPSLERFASLRCHDCRDTGAPIRPELFASPTAQAASVAIGPSASTIGV